MRSERNSGHIKKKTKKKKKNNNKNKQAKIPEKLRKLGGGGGQLEKKPNGWKLKLKKIVLRKGTKLFFLL